MKQCKTCKEIKPLIDFYNEIRNSDGKTGTCIQCIKSRVNKYKIENREIVLEKKRTYATTHKVEKSLYDKEYRKRNRENIIIRNKIKRNNRTQEEKEKISAYLKEYNRKNINKLCVIHKAYSENHKDQYKQYRRKYQNKHQKEIYERNKQYKLLHPELVSIYKKKYKHKRRAILNNLNEHYTKEEMQELIRHSNDICFWCNKVIIEGDMHIDHYIPLTKGGKNTIDNLVVSCSKCNVSKHNKLPEEFKILRSV